MKKSIIVLITIITIFLIFITIYKIQYFKIESKVIETILIEDDKKQNTDNVKDITKYKDLLIENNLTSYEFSFNSLDNDELINGKVFIGDNDYLYLKYNDEIKNILEERIKTIIKAEFDDIGYAISYSGELYIIYLYDINDPAVYKEERNYNIIGFSKVLINTNTSFQEERIMVYTDEGYMYDAMYGFMYAEDMMLLGDRYIIYSDNTISNIYGNMLKNGNEYYKISNYIVLFDELEIFGNNKLLILTDDNSIIYTDEYGIILYKYYLKVQDISYTLNDNEYIDLKLIFEDNSILELNLYDSNNYGFS